jgi:hypothetical protein
MRASNKPIRRIPLEGERLMMNHPKHHGEVTVRRIYLNGNQARTIGVVDSDGRAYEVRKEQLYQMNEKATNPEQVHNAAAALGAKGGKKGVRNPAKARSSGQCRAAANARWERWRRERATSKAGASHGDHDAGQSTPLSHPAATT